MKRESMKTQPRDLTEVASLVGTTVGHTEWRRVTQEEVDVFASLTGDEQWIHTDVERAKASPYGGTIAHGFFLLSLCGPAVREILNPIAQRGLNYGLNRVRFIQPVRVDSRIRIGLEAVEADTTNAEWVTLTVGFTIEVEGASRPACVAEMIVRYYH